LTLCVQAMKQQRVRLMKQLKAESEQFRRTKATMAREILQLKSQVSALFRHVISSATMDIFFAVFMSVFLLGLFWKHAFCGRRYTDPLHTGDDVCYCYYCYCCKFILMDLENLLILSLYDCFALLAYHLACIVLCAFSRQYLLQIPHMNTKFGQHSFICYWSQIWNETNASVTVATFKCQLKSHSSYFDTH